MKGILFFIAFFVFLTLHAQNPISGINMRKNSKWPSQSNGKTVISVSWENPTNDNIQQRNWVREAIEQTWEQHANIDFVGWGKASSNTRGIRIIIDNYGHPHTKGLGTTLDGKKDGMLLNFKFLGNFGCYQKLEDCIKFIAVHEFGHALGLAHEHNRLDCLCHEKPQGSDGDFYVTPCDLNSVMNYCNPKWTNYGKLSTLDIKGIQRIYGKPSIVISKIKFDEIRFVPCSFNLPHIKSIKQKISKDKVFNVSLYTQEHDTVPEKAIANLPNNKYTIRYFHPDDKAKAEDLRKMLLQQSSEFKDISIQNMLPKMSRTYPNYIEIWIK
ncbi:MAG: hypothetical protein ACRBFS_13995 [Aureispira sp.]